jgi:hypothetical protein
LGRTVFFEGFVASLLDQLPWFFVVLLTLIALYLTARELVASLWLGEAISDAALGLCQWIVLLGSATLTVILLCGYFVSVALETYWHYYYPWSIFMT